MKTIKNVNNIAGLIHAMLRIANPSFEADVLQVTMVDHNLYTVLFDCKPNVGDPCLRAVRRLAVCNTAEGRVLNSIIVCYESAVIPALVED